MTTWRRRFDVIVIEGAGSVTELNLRDHDLVNLGLVTAIRAPWLLVADIERGGVFGSVDRHRDLLTADERSLFRGFAINKFRGDSSLFDDGVRMLEERTASRCFGVFPYAADLHLDAEDSLALETRPRTPAPPGARICDRPVAAPVERDRLPAADVGRLDRVAPRADYDFIILPGSKNTIADLAWLRAGGLADWILDQHRAGATVIGICGGYQMLGRRRRSAGIESARGAPQGSACCRRDDPDARETDAGGSRRPRGRRPFGGYEIHLGVTTFEHGAAALPFAPLDDGGSDGAVPRGCHRHLPARRARERRRLRRDLRRRTAGDPGQGGPLPTAGRLVRAARP